jgi:hypothetical protein
MELENLMQQLNSDKHNKYSIPFQIIDAARLKMRVKETNEETKKERWVWKESRAVCLTVFFSFGAAAPIWALAHIHETPHFT